jgi:type II secretory pathway pseudopilin PulG
MMPMHFSKAEGGNRLKSGFTLIEIMVATTLFILVTGVVSGIFVSSFGFYRSSTTFLNAHANVRFVLEAMSREIRTGVDFAEILDSTGILNLALINQASSSVSFRLSGGRLQKCEDFNRLTGSCVVAFRALTSSDVTVDFFRYSLFGVGSADLQQPRITLSLTISDEVGGQRAETILQTTVTQRELDG